MICFKFSPFYQKKIGFLVFSHKIDGLKATKFWRWHIIDSNDLLNSENILGANMDLTSIAIERDGVFQTEERRGSSCFSGSFDG